jgi:hypothetical protein
MRQHQPVVGYLRLLKALFSVDPTKDAREQYQVLGTHPDGRILVLVSWEHDAWYDIYEPVIAKRMQEPHTITVEGVDYKLVRSVEVFPQGFIRVAHRTLRRDGKPRKRYTKRLTVPKADHAIAAT